MIIDARSLANATSLAGTVCIVGGGPAGLTLADGLVAAGIDTIVLESGGDEPDAATQQLNEGELVGEPFVFEGVPKRLVDTRLRGLGGTSNHWTGMCRPLDDDDLRPDPDVPGSGWPIAPSDLRPLYERAARTCDLPTTSWESEWWQRELGMPSLTADAPRLTTAVHQFSPPVRFGETFRPSLEAAAHARLVLWANVTELLAPGDGRQVTAARVRTFSGTELLVQAEVFVVAAGGIESARLLLASDGSDAAGIGNRYDLVGRTFMEHPHVIGGRGHLALDPDQLGYYLLRPFEIPKGGPSRHVWAGIRPSPETRASAQIGAGTVFLWRGGHGPPRGERDAPTEAAAAAATIAAPARDRTTPVTLAIRTEQSPNPESRVALTRQRDALGMRRVSVDWRLTDRDWRTIEETVRLVASGMGEAGLGRLEVAPAGRPLREFQVGMGNHHMGTVRMHAEPGHGVVDPNCRVHGVDNLYVCSSGVFPTAGSANPTLTIVALSHRLADHLVALR